MSTSWAVICGFKCIVGMSALERNQVMSGHKLQMLQLHLGALGRHRLVPM